VTGRTKTEVKVKLRQLRSELDSGVRSSAAERLSTRSLQIVRNCLERAIGHAEIRDLVGRSVAALVKALRGRPGRPSKSLTLAQAQALLKAARESRLYAYVVLSVTTGLRTEELRALRWDEVDLDVGTVAVYRAVRASGDTKIQQSRRGAPPIGRVQPPLRRAGVGRQGSTSDRMHPRESALPEPTSDQGWLGG
jgi:integrase